LLIAQAEYREPSVSARGLRLRDREAAGQPATIRILEPMQPRALVTVLTLLATLLAGELSAQAVRATVTDQGTGAPVAGAMVRVASDSGTLVRAGFSDERGTILLPLDDPGQYVVRASRTGYQTASQRIQLAADGEASVTLQLRASPLGLDTMRVVAAPDAREIGGETFARRAATGRGIYLDSAYIVRRSARWPGELLESVPGIEVVPVHGRTGIRRPVLRMGPRCLNYLVNGMPYYGGWPRSVSLEETLRRNSVVAVEVYRTTDEVPPELQRFARNPRACGLIVYWTIDGWTSLTRGQQRARP
jgi:hypothetical protein